MVLRRMVTVGLVSASMLVGSAGAAQALNPFAVADQAVRTVDGAIRHGGTDTVLSLARSPQAHYYLAGNTSKRYIVVLGARLNPDGTLPEILNARLDAAAAMARAQPGVRVIVSGGATQALPYNEAQAMLAGLTLRGVNPAFIMMEERSYSTVENARNTAAILRGVGAEGIALVSSDSHIGRATGNFQAAAPGLTIHPVGVPGW